MEITNRVRINVTGDVDCCLKHVLLAGSHLPKPWLYAPSLVPGARPPNGLAASPQAWILIVDGAVKCLRQKGYPVTLDKMPPDTAAKLVSKPISQTTKLIRDNIYKNFETL